MKYECEMQEDGSYAFTAELNVEDSNIVEGDFLHRWRDIVISATSLGVEIWNRESESKIGPGQYVLETGLCRKWHDGSEGSVDHDGNANFLIVKWIQVPLRYKDSMSVWLSSLSNHSGYVARYWEHMSDYSDI